MFRFSIIFFTFILFFACGNNKTNEQENKTTNTAQQNATTSQASSPSNISLPSIPLERMQFMWLNCDQIDYIFNDLPVSMSQDEKAGIQNSLRYISEKPASNEMLSRCKSIGNVLFQYNGEIVHEAEIYFSEGCNFYVFLDKQRKPVYSNMMTSSGVKFLAQMVRSVLPPSTQNGQ